MAADRPLVVVHDPKEGHLVYDLLFLTEEEDDKEIIVCSPRPVAHFPFPLDTSATFAVAGGSILGFRYDFWNDTLFHDSVMQVGGYDFWEKHPYTKRDSEGRIIRWCPKTRIIKSPHRFGSYKDMPSLLPMEDGSVIRIDTVIFHGIYQFERFYSLPGGDWRAVPLPKPPVTQLGDEDSAYITTFFVIGARVWISANRRGTYSLDTEHGVWRVEGTWQLPFEGRALYVPELDSVVGFAAKTLLLCAYDVKTGATPVMQNVWREASPLPHEECIISREQQLVPRPSDMPSLAYLGNGKFCIRRPMSTKQPEYYAPPLIYDAGCFLIVELKRVPSGELKLVKRGKMSYMWPPQERQCRYIGLIQPAIQSKQATSAVVV